jgi:hypothetical protein
VSGQAILNLLRGPVGPNPTPNPNPQVGGGGASGPSGGQGAAAPPTGGSGAPQPSPPDLAQLYMQLEQRNRSANEIDRGLSLMAASMSTPSMANAIMNSVPQQQDAGAMMGNMMKLQQAQYLRQQQQIMMNSAPSLARQLFGSNPTADQVQQAQLIIASGKVGDVETNLVGAQDLDQRQYMQYQRDQQMTGQPAVDFATWKNQHVASGAQQKGYAEDKADAISTFPKLDQQYQQLEQNTGWLADPVHRAAVIQAIHLGNAAGGIIGQAGVASGMIDPNVADARTLLNTLADEKFTEGLKDTKNVRSVTEANKIGASMTSLDNRSNSDTIIGNELTRLNNAALSARGNLTAAAGKPVPFKYTGYVDSNYLDPTSPLYNGATMIKPPVAADGSPAASGGAAARAVANERQIQHLKDNPDLAPDFDAKFGPGSSKSILGQ